MFCNIFIKILKAYLSKKKKIQADVQNLILTVLISYLTNIHEQNKVNNKKKVDRWYLYKGRKNENDNEYTNIR